MDAGEQKPIRYEQGTFLLIVLLVSLGFAVVIAPLFGSILWALVLTILFYPVNKALQRRMPGKEGWAAFLTLLLITVIVVLPALFLASALIDELLTFYAKMKSGQIDLAQLFGQMTAALPDWAENLLRRSGWTDFDQARRQLTEALSGSFGALAGQALLVGQQALHFTLIIGVMLYLAFFLLRDGEGLGKAVVESVPLEPHQRNALVRNFIVVTRATIKGSMVVAIVQGAMGGVAMWALGVQGALLLGTMMGIASLIPAVGAGLVWVPVALYLLATGAVVKAIILVGVGVFVIGMVDNILRPVLVGRDTRLPDYVVLITTLGGLEVFGIHGLVVGPVIAAMFISVWTIFADARASEA